MIIDSHHHVWRYTPEEFDWIGDDMSTLRQDFSMPEYSELLAANGIDGAVAIEARQTIQETQWLLELAREYSCLRGVIGWAPLASSGIASILDGFCEHQKFKGVRHVVQAERDDFLYGEDFNRGISQLTQRNLAYDILIIERQLPAAIAFVDRHPNQTFILDHIAKPLIKTGVLQPWRAQMREIAKRENVVCKISGFVTEADFDNWTIADLQPYWESVLEFFGPNRLLFGSDWPVCLAATEYSRWLEIVRNWAAPLSQSEQNALFGETASRVYRL